MRAVRQSSPSGRGGPCTAPSGRPAPQWQTVRTRLVRLSLRWPQQTKSCGERARTRFDGSAGADADPAESSISKPHAWIPRDWSSMPPCSALALTARRTLTTHTHQLHAELVADVLWVRGWRQSEGLGGVQAQGAKLCVLHLGEGDRRGDEAAAGRKPLHPCAHLSRTAGPSCRGVESNA